VPFVIQIIIQMALFLPIIFAKIIFIKHSKLLFIIIIILITLIILIINLFYL